MVIYDNGIKGLYEGSLLQSLDSTFQRIEQVLSDEAASLSLFQIPCVSDLIWGFKKFVVHFRQNFYEELQYWVYLTGPPALDKAKKVVPMFSSIIPIKP